MSRNKPLWKTSRAGEVVDGRYRLIEPLGSGGVGQVYRAERLRIGRVVAVKFLQASHADKDEFVLRFEREALAMSRLYHPHCVGLIDYGVHENAPYLVMDYLSGVTLTEEIKRGPLAPRRAVAIMQQLLSALAYLHGRNVIHRDIKSDNVLLTEQGGETDFVTLLDLGMAKLMAGIGADIEVSSSGLLVGTPSAMSPEQIRGLPLDERTDVYSAGVLLYHLVVGKKPFLGPDVAATLKLQLEGEPRSPRQVLGRRAVSAELERVMLRALAKDRDERFQTADELAAALGEVPEGRGSQIMRIAPAALATPQPRRGLVAVAALGWLVAAGLAVALALSLLS